MRIVVLVSDEYKVITFLNAIFDMYKEVKNAIKYGMETFILDITIDSLENKETKMKAAKKREKYERFTKWGVDLFLEVVKGKTVVARRRIEVLVRKTNGRKCYGCGKLGNFMSECHKEKNELRDHVVMDRMRRM